LIVITVRFIIKVGHEDSFLSRVNRQAKDTLGSERGCKQFDVCRDLHDPRRFFLYEVYADDAAFATHLQSPHLQSFDTDTAISIEERTVERWHRT
jgi:autoinducer 2-degrading protein